MQVELDDVDEKILDLLQRDARITMRALGLAVGLSGPAASDRVHRLEDQGIVRGYRAEVSAAALGLAVVAVITLGLPFDEHSAARFEAQVHSIDEIAECYRISGEDGYLVKVFAADIPALQDVLERIRGFARVRSSVVLRTLKEDRRLQPIPPRAAPVVFHHGAD